MRLYVDVSINSNNIPPYERKVRRLMKDINKLIVKAKMLSSTNNEKFIYGKIEKDGDLWLLTCTLSDMTTKSKRDRGFKNVRQITSTHGSFEEAQAAADKTAEQYPNDKDCLVMIIDDI